MRKLRVRRKDGAVEVKRDGDVPDRVFLDLHCAGSASMPRQNCEARILVTMPFDLEGLRCSAATRGWLVTVTSPQGAGALSVTVLCPMCAVALLPTEMLAAVRRHAPGLA